MLALRPELVDLDHASPDLAEELKTANAERGRGHIDRFVDSIVASVQVSQETFPTAP
jgi:hypothetical protein